MFFNKLFGRKNNTSSSGEDDVQVLKALSKTPLNERNLDWDRAFMAHAGKALLGCRTPQIQNEKNGFPYFQFEIPEIGSPYQSYVLADLIEKELLRDGIGAAFYSYHTYPDVMLSYGELLNFHYRGSFRSHIRNWMTPGPNQFDRMDELMGGDPPSSVLLPETRTIIKEYLKRNGVLQPKISYLNMMTEHGMMNQLVFNLQPEHFHDEKHFQACLSSLAWFFPKHYTYTAMPTHYLEDLFFDL